MTRKIDFYLEIDGQVSNPERGARDVADRIDGAIDRAGPLIRKALRKYLEGVATELVARHGTPWPGGTGHNSLSARSGALIDSIQRSVSVSGDKVDRLVGQIGADLDYAAIHEAGGVIRARGGGYLTVPLPAALDSSGLPKRRSARDWDNTFVKRSRKGNLLIFQRRGGRAVPLYVLKREVRIPARLGMRDELLQQSPGFAKDVRDAIQDAIRGRK